MDRDSHLIYEAHLNEASAPLEMHRTLVDKLLAEIEAEESSVRLMELVGPRTYSVASIISAPKGSLVHRLGKVLGVMVHDYSVPEVHREYEELYGISVSDRAEELHRINPKWDPYKEGPLDARLDKLYDNNPKHQAIRKVREWVNSIQEALAHDAQRAFMAVAEPEHKATMMEQLRDGIDQIFNIPNIGKIDPNDPGNDPNQGEGTGY